VRAAVAAADAALDAAAAAEVAAVAAAVAAVATAATAVTADAALCTALGDDVNAGGTVVVDPATNNVVVGWKPGIVVVDGKGTVVGGAGNAVVVVSPGIVVGGAVVGVVVPGTVVVVTPGCVVVVTPGCVVVVPPGRVVVVVPGTIRAAVANGKYAATVVGFWPRWSDFTPRALRTSAPRATSRRAEPLTEIQTVAVSRFTALPVLAENTATTISIQPFVSIWRRVINFVPT
jgi:hypothetical protein